MRWVISSLAHGQPPAPKWQGQQVHNCGQNPDRIPSSAEMAAAGNDTGELSHITGKHLYLCLLVSRCDDKMGFIFGLYKEDFLLLRSILDAEIKHTLGNVC